MFGALCREIERVVSNATIYILKLSTWASIWIYICRRKWVGRVSNLQSNWLHALVVYGMFGALCREIERVVSNATIHISKLSTWASICIYICRRKWVGRVWNLQSKWLHALVVYSMFGALCREIERVVSNATINILKLSTWASICIYICRRKWVGRVCNLQSKWRHALVVYGMFVALCREIERVVSNVTTYISKLFTWASICIYICRRKWVGRVSNLQSKWLHALVVYGMFGALCREI